MINNKGINNSILKQRNRGLILKLIATNPSVSRIELSKESNLSKMSVTNIVCELMEANYVREVETEGRKTVGRSPIGLDIAENAPKIVGVLLKRTGIMVGLCDLKMNLTKYERHDWTVCNGEILIEKACELIDKVMKDEENVVGIGVGTVGQVDINTGLIINPINFFGISNYPIGSFLGKRYHIPVLADNQNNCAAIGEIHYGWGRKYRDFIYLGVTNGIGSGIVQGGESVHCVNGVGGEIGHMSIDYRGHKCNCGNRGCLETYAGANVVCERFREQTGERIEFQEICARAEEPVIAEILEDTMEKLSVGLLSAVNILNPEAIILGQDAFYLPDQYLAALEEKINSRKISKSSYYCEVVRPSLGKDGVLKGCAAMVADQMYRGNYLDL
ncbi:ROK family transcriptional regulator [Anaerolentibacter hominis]|uniref:ROK family transcriptional regulator n=1 Tax=Anaerolentibacter hominis TaxID=3079009 RepID=UPI0031B7FE19